MRLLVCLVGTVIALEMPLLAEKSERRKRDLSPLATGQEKGDTTRSEEEESRALDQAFTDAGGNPQALIKNLEEFLKRYPQTTRRERVLRTILRQAMQSNAPAPAASAAERLLELDSEDATLLPLIVDLYTRQNDVVSRGKALQYADRLIAWVENLDSDRKPADTPLEKWRGTQSHLLARAYLMRAEIYVQATEDDKAYLDYAKSYQIYPTAESAEKAGDSASRRGLTKEAIFFYATAFAFPEPEAAPLRRLELRRKLGSAYVLQHQSEQGLGDLILRQYDTLMPLLRSRYDRPEQANENLRDPFAFVLPRLDGSELRLSDYRGKVVVADFWATWCGPCRVEGKLLEQVRDKFRDQPEVVFLALNVDEDRTAVPRYVKEEKWTLDVAYAQGLDRLLGIRSLPTVVIFDRLGRVVFRQEGIDPPSFVEILENKVRAALLTGAEVSR